METKPQNLVDILRSRARNQSDRVAFSFLNDDEEVGASITYGELDYLARYIATSLRDALKVSGPVVLLYPPGIDFIAAFFGCLYAAVPAVPAYAPRPGKTDYRIESIIRDSRASIGLTTTSLARSLGPQFAIPILSIDSPDKTLAEDWQDPKILQEDIAFLQYTSGSTSQPKGVVITHRNVLINSSSLAKHFNYQSTSIGVSWLPHFHDMGLIEGILQPIIHGYTTYLMPSMCFVQQPIRWLRAISKFRGTHSGGPNFAYDLCVRKISSEDASGLDLTSWSAAYNGAESIRASTLIQFASRFSSLGFREEAFYPAYGLAEATLKVCGRFGLKTIHVESQGLLSNTVTEVQIANLKGRTLVSCGRSTSETEVKIVDPESFKEVADGFIGEIWISSPCVAQGYWMNPGQTKMTFNAALSDSNSILGYLRTGDLGFLREGELYVTGRLKDMIIVTGQNYYPEDIEASLEASCPAIRPGNIGAFSIEVAGEDKVVVLAELVRSAINSARTKHSSELYYSELAAACQKLVYDRHDLSIYDLVFLRPNSIPRTSSGKIQRSECRKQYLNGLASIWRTRTTLQPIG